MRNTKFWIKVVERRETSSWEEAPRDFRCAGKVCFLKPGEIYNEGVTLALTVCLMRVK